MPELKFTAPVRNKQHSFLCRLRLLFALERCAFASMLCGCILTGARTDVSVNGYEDFRTGANLSESILNVSNARSETFGRAFSYTVDGAVMSQPLIVTDLVIPGAGQHEVMFTTAVSNSVYAFDARSGAVALWKKTLTHLPDGSASSAAGIYSAPVIDRSAGTIYVVAAQVQGSVLRYVLRALALADDSEKNYGPMAIAGSVRIGATAVPFEPTNTRIAAQRAA